jgi:putative ABC transport system permease protein
MTIYIHIFVTWLVYPLLGLIGLASLYFILTSPIPIRYNTRNVLVRWRSTLTTILGIGIVVAVYMVMQTMAAGIEKSSQDTGDPRNIMLVRKGSTAESSSQVYREQLSLFNYFPQIARGENGRPLLSADVVVLLSLPRRDGSGEANVLVRGISPTGRDLRPQVSLTQGRWFVPGKREVVVSGRLVPRFANFDIGSKFKTSGKELTVVGIMDGHATAFDSEIWMDADESRSIFDREKYSSVVARMTDDAAAAEFIQRIESDKRLPLQALPEVDYYSAQTKTAGPIKFIGAFLAIAMSIGAVFAAMNTMYASIGSRTREIGTLRVLGYRRSSILVSFLIEGAFLAFLGGILGCIAATILPAIGYTVGTLNLQTWGETVFQFRLTPELVVQGLVFSVIVGVIGSLFPAIQAARLPVISALKSI